MVRKPGRRGSLLPPPGRHRARRPLPDGELAAAGPGELRHRLRYVAAGPSHRAGLRSGSLTCGEAVPEVRPWPWSPTAQTQARGMSTGQPRS